MLDHVAIPVRDLEASRKFYEPLFEGLGAKVMMEWPGGVLFGTDDGMVALRQSEAVTRSTRRRWQPVRRTTGLRASGPTSTSTTTRPSSSIRTATTSKRSATG